MQLVVQRSIRVFFLFFICVSCFQPKTSTQEVVLTIADTVQVSDSLPQDSLMMNFESSINDTLDALASIIAGMDSVSQVYPDITKSKAYTNFYKEFSKRWEDFDSTRIQQLNTFEDSVLHSLLPPNQTLFYPFSGPDYLYAGHFFPDATKYILVGLEPVGSLDALVNTEPDSLESYFNLVNTSLDAILRFSFFRTNSMEEDLRQKDLDGVLHLLFLFLKKEGNSIVSAVPFQLDSLGEKQFYPSFSAQKNRVQKTKGVEIEFIDKSNQEKVLDYLSINLSDPSLKKNKAFMAYHSQNTSYTTYLKGASYLLHKSYFSRIRQHILLHSSSIVQDDSGIALHYVLSGNRKWNLHLYGKYVKPISLFSKCYQSDLDSIYKTQKVQKLGFGMGYNFKDKNSNLLIAIPY